jgi:hypothetical protein
MLRNGSILLVSLIALGLPREPAAASDLPPQATALIARWNCETTTSNGVHYHEVDNIRRIGQWLHGTARAATGDGRSPYYDYYIGHTDSGWVYINIDPFHIEGAEGRKSQGSYFIGKSANGEDWSVVYPSGQGHYHFSESPGQFSISYTDLTQVCSKAPDQAPDKPSIPSLKCDTQAAGKVEQADSYLTLMRFHPEWWKGEKSWWQGTGSDSASGGHEVYEYNFFPIDNQWISVAINASGDYLVAGSYAKPTLSDTTWTILYPNAGPGFTFEDVSPSNAIPAYFSLVFADGYQTCCPAGVAGPCPLPHEHLPSAG